MLTRGRPCLRRRALSAVLDTFATGPEEPLLFLYPRCVTSRRPIASVNTVPGGAVCAATRRSRAADPRLSSRPLSLGRSSTRWVSSSSAVEGHEVRQQTGLPSEEERRDGFAGVGVPEVLADELHGTTTSYGPMSAGQQPTGNKAGVEKKRPLNIFADIETPEQPLDIFPRNTKANNIPVTNKTHSRPLAATRERALAAVRKLSMRDRRKLRYRIFSKAQVRNKEADQRWDQWTKIRDQLERIQQDTSVWTRKGIKHKVMLVPEETVALLAGVTDMAMKENIWYVTVRHGCRVHIMHPRESEGHYRKAIISGSTRAVELVSERIMYAQNLQESGDPLVDIRKPPFPVIPSMDALKQRNLAPPQIRGVWDFYQAKQRPTPIETIVDFSQQPVTVREFLEYVEDVIGSVVSGPYRRQSNGPQLPHHQRIAKILVALFRDDRNLKILSTAALNQALSFLCEHEFMNSCRTLFFRCEHLATVDTFNIILRLCARRQDIRTFRNLLIYMSRVHIRPDSYTWIAFLDCLVSSEARTSLFTHMLHKGYLTQPGTMRSALQSIIQDIFLTHLRSGGNVDSFLDLIQNVYGVDWFSPSMVNQMFSVTVTLKDYTAMNRLFQICDEHGIKVNSSTLNQILPMFRANIFAALLCLFRYIDRPVFKVTKQLWEGLFLIAFKGRHYNICRVLWRYTCMNGAVTYKMKMSVLSTLTKNVTKEKGRYKRDVYDKIWNSNAGKIIVGIDLHHSRYPSGQDILDPTPPEYHNNPVLYLMTGFQAGEERERQLQLASALVRRDIELGRRYRPLQPLSIMLDAAALMDLQWKGIPRPPGWIVQNAIQIPVKWRGYLHSD